MGLPHVNTGSGCLAGMFSSHLLKNLINFLHKMWFSFHIFAKPHEHTTTELHFIDPCKCLCIFFFFFIGEFSIYVDDVLASWLFPRESHSVERSHRRKKQRFNKVHKTEAPKRHYISPQFMQSPTNSI